MNTDTDSEATPKRSLFTFPPALKYPTYRKFWLGSLASVTGFQMVQFSQGVLIHQMTGSPALLGSVFVASAVPAILLNLFGGVFADRLDKRRLIALTQGATAVLVILLATLTLLEVVQVWHVFAIAFLAGGVNAFDQPARQAIYPHLIERKVMMSAVAMNSSIWQGTRIVAPTIAGVIIAVMNIEWAFYVAGAGSLVMAVVMVSLRVPPIPTSVANNAFRDMWDGLKFIKGNSVFSFLIGMTFFNSFFGMAYVLMMPVFATDILNVGADGQGLLLSVTGVGALATTLVLGSMGTFRGKGFLLIGGAVMFGLTVVAFALTAHFFSSFLLAIALMPLLGIFNSTYMISVMSSLQLMVPDHMRGRVMGFYGMTWNIMPLGGGQAGAIGEIIGVPFAIALGGGLVAAFALGPAMINGKVRNLGSLLQQFERGATRQATPQPSSTPAGDD